jgi:hypothetical protein
MFARAALLAIAMSGGVLACAASAPADPGPGPLPAQLGLTPSPAQLQFGEVGIHLGGSPQQSVTLANESLVAVTLMQATVSGTDASDFQVVYDECANQTIQPGSACRIEVRFQPQRRGEASATLSIGSFGGEGTFEVPLAGTGSTGTLSANHNSLSFSAIPYTRGEHEENQSEGEQVNIEAREAGVQIESVSITGPDASSFSVQYGNCEGDQLGTNNWCDAFIRFQPLSPGLKHAALVVKSDASSGTIAIPLEGQGLFGPSVSLSSNESQLGEIPLGSAASHTFTVTDGGDYPLFIQQSFLVSGTPKMFPLLSNTCNTQILMPGSSCEFTVGFEPTTLGEKDVSLILITNATPQIHVLGLDGVGVLPKAAPAGGSPAPLSEVPQLPTFLPGSKRVGVTPHLLTFTQGSRLYSSIGNETVDTGVNAQCPAGADTCVTESIITARAPLNRSKTGLHDVGHIAVLLGSRIASLRGGERALVSIPLTRSAVALLRRHGHLRATIAMVIRSGGRIIAERARTVTLMA